MPHYRVTVAVPTLAADASLLACVRALLSQTVEDLEIVVVDNSGVGRAQEALREIGSERVRVLVNERNTGFGAAVNQAFAASAAPFLATVNDDAEADPRWAEALLRASDATDVGMWASRVMLPDGTLDSAGMLLCPDGIGKQRGHGRPPADFAREEEVLLPSGSAALYRRAVIEETGGFDGAFFLYCEDTDLGLRARWLGWRCLYVPDAVVHHRYSHTAGRASPLKAWYVERNRLSLVVKCFPGAMLWMSPWNAAARYFWHVRTLVSGRGSAGRFREEGHGGARLVWYVLRAHWALVLGLPRLIRQRRLIQRTARVGARQFRSLVRSHAISPREVAEA